MSNKKLRAKSSKASSEETSERKSSASSVFTFPKYGMSIEASSLEEARRKLEARLGKSEAESDDTE